MKRNYITRCTSLLMSMIVFVVLTMASATEVSAASSKNFYLPKTEKTTYSYSSSYIDGSTNTTNDSWTYSYTYDKSGLQTKSTSADGYSKYTRNSKGYVTVVKTYNKKGQLTNTTEFTRKSNGDASKVKSYDHSGGKKTLQSTTTYTYWSKGKVKKSTYKPVSGSKSVYTYDKKGNETSYSSNDGKYKINYKLTYKNGRLVKQVATYSGAMTGGTVATTDYTYTIKNGKVTKVVEKYSSKNNEGAVETKVTTTTNTYNKRGDIKKSVSETKQQSSVGTYTSRMTTTFTYKKVSVKKKYWGLYK